MKRLFLGLFCLSMLASHASESSGWRLLSPQGSEAQFAGSEVIESIDEVLLASSSAAPIASPTSMQASAEALGAESAVEGFNIAAMVQIDVVKIAELAS